MTDSKKIAILGCGSIGSAMARGLIKSAACNPQNLILTRRRLDRLDEFQNAGCLLTSANREAVEKADILIIAVQPQELMALLREIADLLQTGRHTLLSAVSGAEIKHICRLCGDDIGVVRIMPNLAVAICESMTCLACDDDNSQALITAEGLFARMGQTLVIREELMIPATALCVCGIAFFFRAIRAASQGGIEIGFDADDALKMSAQTAKGAAALLNMRQNHPETEIDRVTTPRGCTIAGLNNMEHRGFSSAMIRGIITSAEKAEKLFKPNNNS